MSSELESHIEADIREDERTLWNAVIDDMGGTYANVSWRVIPGSVRQGMLTPLFYHMAEDNLMRRWESDATCDTVLHSVAW